MAPSILVVEDDVEASASICEALVAAGYAIVGAVPSGEAAIELAARRNPQLVLMDVAIEGTMDGIATAAILRERYGVPIVFLTGFIDDATFRRAKETAPLGYVKKPFTPRDLRIAVEIALHQHALEQALAARERWFSTTLRSIGDAVLTTDADERVTFMNPAAEALLGAHADAALGRAVEELLRVEGGPAVQAVGALRAVMRSRAPKILEDARIDSPCGAVEIEGTVAPLADEAGTPTGTVMVFRDVSERRRLEKRLATAERLAAIGTMVAGMQHELNNPLATVVANLQFVVDLAKARAANDAEMNEAVAALHDASEGAERIRRVVDDLRHFSRADDTARGPVDVVLAIQSAARITAHAVRHHATIRWDLTPTPPVLATEAQLTRVFVNLLLSAAQATGDGRAEQHVIALVSRTDAAGRAVAELTHDGAELTPDEIRHAFDPTPGSESLALAICQGIVASLGGEIEVESGRGAGTTYRVTLPPAPRSTASTVAPRGAATASGRPRARARILVVDDEPAIGHALRRMLGRDHDVVLETDAQAALDLLVNDRFDVVFCDLMMPRLSGMELFTALSERSPEQAERVVFLTGGAFSPRSEEFLEAHHARCLPKPFTREAVTDVVRNLVER